MTIHWTTDDLPGQRWNPNPDKNDDDPWCCYPDLNGQGADSSRLATMTTIPLTGGYL